MAIEQQDRTWAIWSSTSGTTTARPWLRNKTGRYDPLLEETDDRPISGQDFDAATEGATLLTAAMPDENLPDQNLADVLQTVTYTVNTTTGVVTRIQAAGSLIDRQKRVRGTVAGRRNRWEWSGSALSSWLDNASFDQVRDRLRKWDNVEAHPSWGTNPEAVLADAAYAEPTVAEDPDGPLIQRVASYLKLGSILRDKFAPRAAYDFNTDLKLGPFYVSAADVEVALLDLGPIPLGNIYAISYAFEFRSPTAGNPVSVKVQSRGAYAGGALPAWQTDATLTSSSTAYSPREYTYVFGGNWSDVEFRLIWNAASANGLIPALKNVSIVATRFTISE